MIIYTTLISSVNDAIRVHEAASHTHSCFIRNNAESITDLVDEMSQFDGNDEYSQHLNRQASKTRKFVDDHKHQAEQFDRDIKNLKSIASLLYVKQKATPNRLKKYYESTRYINMVKNRNSNIESVERAIKTFSDKIRKNNLRITLANDIIRSYNKTPNAQDPYYIDYHRKQKFFYESSNARCEYNIQNLKAVIKLLNRQK